MVVEYLLKKRRSALPTPRKKRRSALPSPREKGRMTMATFLLSSVKGSEGGDGLCNHLLEKRGSGLRVLIGKGV